MYTIYRTDGFITGSIDTGEANRYVNIFTKNFGMVGALVQGARALSSRHRHHLQNFSFVHIGLVRGKRGWRLTNSIEILPSGFLFGKHESALLLFARLGWLLNRLVRGEERNDFLFDSVSASTDFIHGETDSIEYLTELENITVLRILHSLGYIREHKDFAQLILKAEVTRDLLLSAQTHRRAIVQEINRALTESQL